MRRLLKNYWPTICYIVIICASMIMSTWVKNVFLISDIFSKGATILIYLPFIAAILWKLIFDIKNKVNIKKTINIIYYCFAVYYVLISVYRFIYSLEIKENLYYFLVLFGSIALFMQLSEKNIAIKKATLQNNIVSISAIMALIRFICYFLVGPLFLSYPINMNIMTGLNIITMPFLVDYYKQAKTKKTKIFVLALMCLILVEVLTSSARMMCTLALMVLLVQIIVNFKNKAVFKRLIFTCLCALLVIIIMFVGNVKNTRYAIFREFSVVKKIVYFIDSAVGTDMNNEKLDEEQEMVEAVEQIQRSDSMRQDLINMGIEQVKQNPIFGTGNVTYSYFVSGYTIQQSSHNFLIEALICYGIIGVLLIIVLILLALYKSKIFSRKNKGPWQNKISVFLTFVVFFAMGSLQPLVFNSLLCPVFMMLFANYDKIAQEDLVQ